MRYIIGLGAQKSGTTLVYDLLKDHPQIDWGSTKEQHYFDMHKQVSIDDYNNRFGKLIELKMDLTPIYIFYPGCIEKIKQTLPPEKTKYFIILRDPIKRAYSHYHMTKRSGREKLPFYKTLDVECNRMKDCRGGIYIYSYFERSRYFEQVKRAFELLGKENVRVYIFEEIIKIQQEFMNDFCDFAKIDALKISPVHSHEGFDTRIKLIERVLVNRKQIIKRILNKKAYALLIKIYVSLNRKELYKEPISEDFQAILKNYFKKDILGLETLLDRDLRVWE